MTKYSLFNYETKEYILEGYDDLTHVLNYVINYLLDDFKLIDSASKIFLEFKEDDRLVLAVSINKCIFPTIT